MSKGNVFAYQRKKKRKRRIKREKNEKIHLELRVVEVGFCKMKATMSLAAVGLVGEGAWSIVCAVASPTINYWYREY